MYIYIYIYILYIYIYIYIYVPCFGTESEGASHFADIKWFVVISESIVGEIVVKSPYKVCSNVIGNGLSALILKTYTKTEVDTFVYTN